MKKICFFSGDISRSGGTERVTIELCNHLIKLKHNYQISILSMTQLNKECFFYLDSSINTDILYSYKINLKRDYFKTVINLNRYLRDNSIDILIDVDSILDIFSIPATFFLNTKVVSWEHFNFYENLGVRFRDWGRLLSSKYASYLVTITEEDLLNFRNGLNLKCPSTNIYNPIQVRRDVDKPKNTKIILSAGRLTYQKGFDLLIEVAKEVFACKHDWRWIIVGEGEDRELLQKKILDYNLEKNVMLLGGVKDIDNYYKEAEIFVMTSRFEGLGMVILEAFNYGVPVISFDCPVGPKEIIRHGINGFLVPNQDVECMTRKINLLMEDNELRKYFSKNTKIDLDKFNIENVGLKWIELFEKLS